VKLMALVVKLAVLPPLSAWAL